MMKIQLTLSPAQLKLLSEAVTHSTLYDKVLRKDDPQWVDLKRTIQQADDEVNHGDARLASYKIIK
jgi:hypothetical protein